ncbi:YTH domain-containing protein ECT1 isoform X2 [Diospyros lotus]|nr:YTH domain-containing protein ECT1 isoform X2 [Diospyros lotus]
MKDQLLSSTNGRSISPNASKDTGIGQPGDTASQSGSFGLGGDHPVYQSNVYAPQALYYKGPGQWDEYTSYVNTERLDIGSPGIYNDKPSLVFHTSYGYGPQIPYGPYSPVTTPLPSVGADAQLYSPQQYQFSGPPYYQQLVSPSMQYASPPTTFSQPELNSVVGIDQQDDRMIFGPGPSYPSPVGPFGRGNFSGDLASLGFPDLQLGFDAFGSGGLSSHWPKPLDRERVLPAFSPAVSPQTIGGLGSFGQNLAMDSQQARPSYGFGSGSNSYNRAHLHSDFNQGSSFVNASVPHLGTKDRGWLALDYGRRRGRADSSLCNCSGTLDILNEQNRGPRASKLKSQTAIENGASADGNKYSSSTTKTLDESYNHPDFVTDYKDAKFFIIKSYNEDNVHKSIKYGIWASTPNGNRKLDAAYREAKEKQSSCPIFLFFSVNASAQFCGVAEMVGPVDFDKSVDYWQQDKWSGQFPVKWHIIKDVPNSQFRHIVLENNDNKPVTNSRDTQEVKLKQGIEMLNIFKNYESEMSILDDFDFYEDRQKAMQERKARQQASLVGMGVVGGQEQRKVVALSTDNLLKPMSKSFAQVVRLEEFGKEGPVVTERSASASDGSINNRVEDNGMSAVVSTAI